MTTNKKLARKKKVTEFKTEHYIVRERFSDTWTVEEKDGNNVIGEIRRTLKSNPWCFESFFKMYTHSEMVELAECIHQVDNITKNR